MQMNVLNHQANQNLILIFIAQIVINKNILKGIALKEKQ